MSVFERLLEFKSIELPRLLLPRQDNERIELIPTVTRAFASNGPGRNEDRRGLGGVSSTRGGQDRKIGQVIRAPSPSWLSFSIGRYVQR